MYYYYYGYDYTIWLIIPAIILSIFAQIKINSAYNKYSKIYSKKNMTGAQVAMEILNRQGISDVSVEVTSGFLSDHYDPRSKKVRLSKSNFESSAISAISVAAHEVGHAIQHNEGYAPLSFRTMLAPIVNIGSMLSWPLIVIGLLIGFSNSNIILQLGVILFALVVLFQIVTLPVEFNASRRANDLLERYGFLESSEVSGSKKVLGAAALTYVAAAITSALQLLRLILMLNNRRR